MVFRLYRRFFYLSPPGRGRLRSSRVRGWLYLATQVPPHPDPLPGGEREKLAHRPQRSPPLVRSALCVAILLAPSQSHAVLPDEVLSNPAQEQRARALSRELRCMVCQNQSIDDSDAPLARDLRLLVRERIKSGESDAQVLDFLVERYGAFVLLKPRFELQTLLLWLLPPLALAIGAAGLFLMARRNSAPAGTAAQTLTADEQAELQRVLNGDEASRSAALKNASITKD